MTPKKRRTVLAVVLVCAFAGFLFAFGQALLHIGGQHAAQRALCHAVAHQSREPGKKSCRMPGVLFHR